MTEHYVNNVKPSLTKRWGFTVLRCITYIVLAGLTAWLLGGCASQVKVDPLPTVVKVPVLVPCLDKPTDKPQFKTDAEILDGSDYQVVVNLRLDRDQRRVYEAALEADQQACINPEQTK